MELWGELHVDGGVDPGRHGRGGQPEREVDDPLEPAELAQALQHILEVVGVRHIAGQVGLGGSLCLEDRGILF